MIGFIGLGNMGKPMASNLCRKGSQLMALDVDRDRVRALEGLGATAGADVAGVAQASEIVFTMLPTTATVEEVIGGAAGLIATLRAGSVIVDMSTIDPLVTDRLAAAA